MLNVWIKSEDMTYDEKITHPEHETTGGFLKSRKMTECCILWWNSLSEHDKNVIRAIPNFDSVIFKQITGIDADSRMSHQQKNSR